MQVSPLDLLDGALCNGDDEQPATFGAAHYVQKHACPSSLHV